jgi:putative FmdB family regulatory protein
MPCLFFIKPMPIYEYKCSSCFHITGILVQGFSEPDNLKCESCGSDGLRKIISKVNYHGSQTDRLASYNPNSRKSDSFFSDSRNIGLEAERMLKKAGVEPTDDFKAKLEKVRTDPGSVLKDS